MNIRHLLRGGSVFYMKNAVHAVLFAALLMIAASCQPREEIKPGLKTSLQVLAPAAPAGVTLKTHRLASGKQVVFTAFADRQAFENAMAMIEPEKARQEWEKTMNFKSLRRSYEEAEANGRADYAAPVQEQVEDQLATLLSPEGLIQIGDYLFRLDKATETVYAVAARKTDTYDDLLKGNDKNPELIAFSTSDEVLTMIESGVNDKKSKTKVKGFLCPDDRARKNKAAEYAPFDPSFKDLANNRGDSKHLYQQNGLWFKLFAKAKYQRKGEFFWRHEIAYTIHIGYASRYKLRCGGETEGGDEKAVLLDNKLEVVAFSGSRALQWYSMVSRHTYWHDDDITRTRYAQVSLQRITG